MSLNQDNLRRRSIRLKGYDYSCAGAYFITVCVQHRLPLLGEIEGDIVHLKPAGKMIQTIFGELPLYYPGIEIDASVVMPDHFHGIIVLTNVGAGPRACPAMTLNDIVQRFKSLATTRYRNGVRDEQWLPFRERLWQRNYWERVIRDERELNRIREYIEQNPNKDNAGSDDPWLPRF